MSKWSDPSNVSIMELGYKFSSIHTLHSNFLEKQIPTVFFLSLLEYHNFPFTLNTQLNACQRTTIIDWFLQYVTYELYSIGV